MKTSYNKNIGEFDIAWPGRVSRHDIVYKAPPSDPMQYGMPIGNGDIGALVWCDDRRIIIAVNKCDLWDDAKFGPFHNWNTKEEEFSTTLRHACRIIIDFGTPVFDTFYLKDFEGRLRLKDGCAEIFLDTPFGSLSAQIFVCFNSNVICSKITTDFVEESGVEITLERYGSRTFSHWYAFFKRDPSIGLSGTKTWVKENDLLLSHKLSTGEFVCALRADGADFQAERKGSHAVVAKKANSPEEFTLYAHVTSPFDEDNGEESAITALEVASNKGFDKLLKQNEECWKKFWEKSFIETDDDYLDNLWHLAMYYSCAGQRGRYPGRFINSLWNWNRDVQPWNFYFHWNQQEVYWGLNAAGHHELCEPYLNYRFNGMVHSKESARELFGVEDGIFVSDVCDRRGYNSANERDNHTPAGEIALDFWRQYLYTCDKEFLCEKALPYMLGAANFFKTRFVREADGKYHATGGTAYEGSDVLYDVVTELAMARALFSATLCALKEAGATSPNEKIFRDILENTADFTCILHDSRMLDNNGDGTYTIKLGIFKGNQVACGKVFSLGRADNADSSDNPKLRALKNQYVPQWIPRDKPEDEPRLMDGVEVLRKSLYNHFVPSEATPELTFDLVGSHPQANVAMVFPMNVVGVGNKGNEWYDVAVTTAMTSRSEQIAGWDTMPIVLARLGLAEQVDTYIYDFPSQWQYYNNGFGHYGPNGVMVPDMLSPFRRDLVGDADGEGETIWAETFPFRHMGLEPLGVLSATMNERLLQSYDGFIRIAPAYGKRDASFKLHAVGGFEVSAQICNGQAAFVAVRSLYGNKLKLSNPWTKAFAGGVCYSDAIIEIDTNPDEVIFFTPDENEQPDFEKSTPAPNSKPKVRSDRHAMLGTERSF